MIRQDIQMLSAYAVPNATGMIKLDAMENPYSIPDDLREQWLHALAHVELNRYPDADMYGLRCKIARQDGVHPDQVLIGNGSDEIIQMLIMAISDGVCVAPAPSFVMYEMISKWLKRPFASVPLNDDFSLSAKTFLEVCGRNHAPLAFLPCPNNPTGNLWDRAVLEQIVQYYQGTLIIDEAYLPFAGRTHTDLISERVMVMRTFSKLGWAGLRFGYLLGDAKVIAHLNKVRLPYNINSLTQATVTLFLDHADVFRAQTEAIKAERARLMQALGQLPKLKVYPSDANFVLLRLIDGADAEQVFLLLKQQNILIKYFAAKSGALVNCLRVTVGTEEENNALLEAMEEALS